MSPNEKRSAVGFGTPIKALSQIHLQRGRSNIKKWLSIGAIALANTLILALFAAYFSNQRLDLITALGIIADSMGIITGLLGIWFFFESEKLNNATTSNLERTTKAVDELANQMWGMLQSIVSSFIENETRQEFRATQEAVKEVQNKLPEGEASQEFREALQEFSKRLESLESTRDKYPIIRPQRVHDPAYPATPLHVLLEKIASHFLSEPEIPIVTLSKYLGLYYAPQNFSAENWEEVFKRLAQWEFIYIMTETPDEISPETLLTPGRQLEPYTAEARYRIASAKASFPWNQ